MKTCRCLALPFLLITSFLIAWLVISGPNNAASIPRAVGEEVHSGTYEEPRLINEPAWPGAVFLDAASTPPAFFIAAFGSEPDKPNPPFPATAQSDASWTYAGQHSGLGPDLKAFTEPTRVGALHVAQIDSKNALLRSKIDGVPSAQTPYPLTAQSNDFWEFIGFFEKNGTDTNPKNQQDLVWPGVFVSFERSTDIYVALRTGYPITDDWPTPDTQEGVGFWKYAGTHSGTALKLPKPWTDRSTDLDSYYVHPLTPQRHYFYASRFTGFPALLGAQFPQGAQSDHYWTYRGRHSGLPQDPKSFGEPARVDEAFRGLVEGKAITLYSKFDGVPSSETPFPDTLKDNDFWRIGDSLQQDKPLPTVTASNEHWTHIPVIEPLGTFESPSHFTDYSQSGSVFVDGSLPGQRTFYVSRFEGYPADDIDGFATVSTADPNWVYAGKHAGVLTDLKPFDDVTRVGAMHEGLVDGRRVLLRSRFAGLPSAATPYPQTLSSNDHWEFISTFTHAGTAQDLKDGNDFTWPGALHLDEAQQLVFASSKQGQPGADGWVFPVGETSDENWKFVTSLTTPGTPEAPRERNGLSTPGVIFVDQRGLAQKKLFRARFSGFATDVGAVYPSGNASNSFYEYAGEHAGTFKDPKPFTDPTWPGAVHLTTIAGELAFLRSKISGTPTAATPYPETLASNDFWDFEFVTRQAGTLADPKQFSGQTWPGAVHEHTSIGDHYLFEAQQFGDPYRDGWPNPGNDTRYWKRLGKVIHKGTFEDPKGFAEFTLPGRIHTTTESGDIVYYRSLVEGMPADHDYIYPTPGTSNEYWEYLGRNLPEGTWADPKDATGFTWPGRIHVMRVGDKRLYLGSKVDGLLAEHDWPVPEEGNNSFWWVAGESRHAGDFASPKDQAEVTWVGAIHMRQDTDHRTYYRSKVSGNLAANGGSTPLPEANASNGWWDFVGTGVHAGTLEDPMLGAEITWPGLLHKTAREGRDEFYQARFSGVSDSAHPFPDSAQSNDDWAYIGKSSMQGIPLAPKDAHEITWPDALHRFELEGKAHYVKSKISGVPPASGWVFPAPPNSDKRWNFVDMGIHAGTWDDTKPYSDATWPGAIHMQIMYVQIGEIEGVRRWFYRSKFWGRASEHEGGYSNRERFDDLGFSYYMGTLDSPKSFDQPTWVGAIHLDRQTHFLFEARKSGEMGVEVGERPTTPSDNESWHFLGAHRHSGKLNDPKDWDEYTWPGRLHRYEYNGKTLYFNAQMTGTPSEKNWHYPTDESSNGYWSFYGATEHAGTFSDPHQRNEVTWKGAIHAVKQTDKTLYFAATRSGSAEIEGWPYPSSAIDNEYFKYKGQAVHAGTITDPKGVDEVVWPGNYVRINRVGVDLYFIAKNNGIPSDNAWPFPAEGSNSADWDYYGASRHAGTVADPKDLNDVSWRNNVHVVETAAMRMLFRIDSDKEGIPSQGDWTIPTAPIDYVEGPEAPEISPSWEFLTVTHKNGTFEHPKSASEWTQKGLIHSANVAHQSMFFRSRFDGKFDYPENQPVKSIPETGVSNQWWEFLRKGQGTAAIPNGFNDYSLIGDINVYYYAGKRYFFKAKKEGRPSDANWYYPTSAMDNNNWEYIYSHVGTVDDPKGWNEQTHPGLFHRYEYGDKTLFFTAKKEGIPSRHNWYYPTTPVSNEDWTYIGLHAGTWQDPKTWNEPTWPSAIHWYPEKNLYFSSLVTGTPSDNNWYYPTTPVSNSYWKSIDINRHMTPGINDSSKTFDQYTWVTAHNAYLDDLQPQLNRGVRGFMLDLHFDYTGTGEVRVCHPQSGNQCSASSPTLRDMLANDFIPFLQNNRDAILTLQFESTVTRQAMQDVFSRVPAIAELTYNHEANTSWSSAQEMISKNKRVVMFSDGSIPGEYEVGGKKFGISTAPRTQVENTYNLGDTALVHNWECATRYSGMDLSLRNVNGGVPRLFVLNQFHSWGSSEAHAGDVDNNLTRLQRRVERYCGEPTGWRKPNYLAIDFNQVGDTFPYAAALSQGGLFFYEGNGADRNRDTTCVLPGNQGGGSDGIEYDLRLPAKGCEEDEIRSMELEGIAAGTRIELYDSPSGDRQDDFTLIDVKQSIPMGKRIRIDSLEGSATDNFYYRKLAFRNNGLDGKVSRITVRNTPQENDIGGALIVFYESNNASQNIVCSVPFNKNHEFKMGGGNNSYGCDNDEIRSAIIVSAGRGSKFTVYGHPEASSSQGRTIVTVKRRIDVPVTVPSFNRSYENDSVKVEVSHGGDLDGSISYASFQPDAAPEPDPPPKPEPEPEPDPGPPPAPGNLRAENVWARPLNLMWNASARAVKYKVYWYFTVIGETPGTSFNYNNNDGVAGRYHVVAFDSKGRRSPQSGYLWIYSEGKRLADQNREQDPR